MEPHTPITIDAYTDEAQNTLSIGNKRENNAEEAA
jgi:hypothetical protein